MVILLIYMQTIETEYVIAARLPGELICMTECNQLGYLLLFEMNQQWENVETTDT